MIIFSIFQLWNSNIYNARTDTCMCCVFTEEVSPILQADQQFCIDGQGKASTTYRAAICMPSVGIYGTFCKWDNLRMGLYVPRLNRVELTHNRGQSRKRYVPFCSRHAASHDVVICRQRVWISHD